MHPPIVASAGGQCDTVSLAAALLPRSSQANANLSPLAAVRRLERRGPLVNREIGRFATIGTAADGLTYFNDYGWAGETRIVGIYIDPLVAAGEVDAGSDFDNQRRFQNGLLIESITGFWAPMTMTATGCRKFTSR